MDADALPMSAGDVPAFSDLPEPVGDDHPDLAGAFWGIDSCWQDETDTSVTNAFVSGDIPGACGPQRALGLSGAEILPLCGLPSDDALVKRRRVTKPDSHWREKAATQHCSTGELLPSLSHRERTKFRDQWVTSYIKAHGDELSGMVYKEKVRHVQDTHWKSFDEGARAAWFLYCASPDKHVRPDLTGSDGGHPASTAPEEGVDAHVPSRSAPIPLQDITVQVEEPHPDDYLGDDAKDRHMGYLLTWQGSWGHTQPEVVELASLGLKGAALQTAVKSSKFFQWLWGEFRAFAMARARERHWPKYSGKCELTLGAKDPTRNIVHFHLQVSDVSTRRKLSDKRFWKFLGSQPHIQATAGRGRYLFKAVCNGHYYAQAPKFGSLFVFTNYPCFKECPVEQAYVFGLWKRYKMDDDVAQEEIVRARGRGTKGFLQEIDFNRRWRKARLAAAEKKFLEWSIPLKPSKVFRMVVNWMKAFVEEYGRATRFPFLVLNGESRLGKTRYASQLWGPEHTLVISCQGVRQPNLKDFDRSKKCIVYDEASHSMVFANKQVFQAGLDEVMLGQSACNEHVYSAWLYAVPMVVSTNDWLLGAKDEEVAWLEKNSVVVDVSEPMWCEEALMALTDGPLS